MPRTKNEHRKTRPARLLGKRAAKASYKTTPRAAQIKSRGENSIEGDGQEEVKYSCPNDGHLLERERVQGGGRFISTGRYLCPVCKRDFMPQELRTFVFRGGDVTGRNGNAKS